MRYKHLIGVLLLATSLLLSSTEAIATIGTDHYDVSNGYSSAGEGISWITFDDWDYVGPCGQTWKDFAPCNGGFGELGQRQHVVTLWPDRLTPDRPQTILGDMTNTPVYTNANMDGQINFYYWAYTTPGFDIPGDIAAYKDRVYSASTRTGCTFDMKIDVDGDYLVKKDAMHFAYIDTFSYVDDTGVNPPQDVKQSVSFQPYPVSDAIGWCGSVKASHPAALAMMGGQLTFDFVMDAYSGDPPHRSSMGSQIVPKFEMRAYGTLKVHVWVGADLQTFSSSAVSNNTYPGNTDHFDPDPAYYNRVSFHGGGVLPDGAWVSADSYNPDGSPNLNEDGTWNVRVVDVAVEGTANAVWHKNSFAGYAFILRADALRMIDWFNKDVYGDVPLCTPVNCDDGNPCTVDSCVGGFCLNKEMSCLPHDRCNPSTGACEWFDFCPAGVTCDDNNLCTTDSCDPAVGCVHKPVVCDDSKLCTTDSCNPATGACVFAPVVCNDVKACATNMCDTATGACKFTPVNCDDGNLCTTDTCDAATGTCVHTPTARRTVNTTNNNFTMNQPDGVAFGGTNDVQFTWDGTKKTSVAVSGQVSNATLASVCPFFGKTWAAHDVAVYGPGTYTVFTGCPAGSPSCGSGEPITFTVNAGEMGAHMLFDWNVSNNIDVVNVWKKGSYDQGVDPTLYSPVPMWTDACSSNPGTKVWDWMSYDWDGDGVNGGPMVDGPFIGMNGNFNVMGIPVVVDTTNNNFTMNQPDGVAFGGTNDVRFTWDGNLMTSVAVSGQVSNATLASVCPFFGKTWAAHDVAVYGPGTYTVYAGCPAGSPGCGLGVPITFTVNAGEMAGHMLFNWNNNDNIDVVDVWKKGSYDQGVDPTLYSPVPMWTGACGSNPDTRVWDLMSYDWDGDGVNGYAMVDGPFIGMNTNFNLMGAGPSTAECNDNNACTTDTLDADGCVCIHTPIVCNDNNACTTDTCNPATGCVHTAISCYDGNACTTDSCDMATSCVYTPVTCGAGETCDPADGICKAISTGADVGVLQFLLPRHVDNCDTKQKIVIVAKNFSKVPASGTIQLKKDGVLVKEWTNVNFEKSRAIVKSYLYNPAGDGEKTITWSVDIIVPGDPNIGNNSSTKTMTVDKCKKHGHNGDHDEHDDDLHAR